MADHDHSYKQLFSNPELVRDLLQGFVLEDWVHDLDIATLERVNSSYISDDLREREDDIIWRVKLGSSWIYVYLLIEFQSTVDRYMALRLLTYLGLLYQDLVKSKSLPTDGKLPPVLPLVLYNGDKKWNAAISISGLIQDVAGDLAKYRPDFQYLLLEENRYSLDNLPTRNLVSAVFQLEKSQSPEDIRAVVSFLIQWVKSPEQASIRRAFTVWINRVLLPVRMPGQEVPHVNDLLEVENMLAERVKEWTREWTEEGLQKGLQKGLQRGKQEGFSEMLHGQLTKKFGPLSAEIENKLNNADHEQLLLWSERILTANSLGDVFGH
jgi:predicted transposase/invertase (TIGR01784 family)